MVIPEPIGPLRIEPDDLLSHTLPALKLNTVSLSVVETDSLDPGVGAQRVPEADGRILPAREEDQRPNSLPIAELLHHLTYSGPIGS